jgi:pimeloyl-ACP methyl ester carboxylesterase
MATFVLVHGAWQGGWTWSRVTPLLRARGHEVHTPTLTGCGERVQQLSPQIGLETHIEDVAGTILFERLRDVVLVGHSYGGQVIAGTASRLPDRVGQLIYLDAFLPDDGVSATMRQPEQIAHHYRQSVDETGFGWLIPPRKLEVLGVTDPADVAWLTELMLPHPYKTFNDPVTVSQESLAIPSAYVECIDWMRVFTPQRELAVSRGWPVRELATGHQAMTTAPQALADTLDELSKHEKES